MISLHFYPSLISKYRQILLGIGAIGVVLAHNVRWNEWPWYFSYPSGLISAMVFTEGFLFLSGFGLYYSLEKNNNLLDFYKKRVYRLYVPFAIILLLFSVINVICNFSSIGDVLNDLACIPWFWGYGGYWYVALSLFLYLIYPWVHKYVFASGRSPLLMLLALICIMYVINLLLNMYYHSYFASVEIGIMKAPVFFVGAFCGYLSKRGECIKYCVPILAILAIAAFVWRYCSYNSFSHSISSIVLRLLCIVIICNYLSKNHTFCHSLLVFFNWAGKYSLEIYLLHMMIYVLLNDITKSLGLDDFKAIITLLNIPLALLLCSPIQKFCKIVVNYISK